ncbi:MAG: hypothetical protein U0441_31635 [Polyangiaceae bacterium]
MKRRGIWLGVAVLLLALSAWLMSRGDTEKPTVRPPKVEFPRGQNDKERDRNDKRRSLPSLDDPSKEGFHRKRDPLLVALPTDPKKSALVFELDALKESPIMKAWLDCVMAREDGDARDMERFKEKLGVDPFEDIERVAMSSEKLMILQGNVGKAKFDPASWDKRTYGEKGTIYTNPVSGRVVALWGPDMMLVSGDPDSADAVQDAIDRLESTDPSQRPLLSDYQAYGDVYGVLSPEDLAKSMGGDQRALADKVKQLVDRVDFHMDAADDVAMVADVRGGRGDGNADDMEDLAKSFGAALAVGRIKAQQDGDDKLAQLLDFAKVRPGGGAFTVDVALPYELLKEMGPCRKDADRPWKRRPPATAEPSATAALEAPTTTR